MPGGLPSLPNDGIASYHFSVEIDNTEIAQFSELSGITSEIDVIDLKENGFDGKPVIKKLPGSRKPPDDHAQARQERVDGPLELALRDVPGQGLRRTPQRFGRPVRLRDSVNVARYNFMNGWVSKISMGSAKAGANEVLTEECTIVCEELIRVK